MLKFLALRTFDTKCFLVFGVSNPKNLAFGTPIVRLDNINVIKIGFEFVEFLFEKKKFVEK